MLVKLYGLAQGDTTVCYIPAECTGIKKTAIEGSHDEAHISTSYVERQNLTMRMPMKRFRHFSMADLSINSITRNLATRNESFGD